MDQVETLENRVFQVLRDLQVLMEHGVKEVSVVIRVHRDKMDLPVHLDRWVRLVQQVELADMDLLDPLGLLDPLVVILAAALLP